MIEDWELLDEELLQAAAESPVPCPALRGNVIRAAEAACRLRRIRNRLLCAACLLVPLVAGGIWARSLLVVDGRERPQSAIAGASAVDPPAGAVDSGAVSAPSSRAFRMLACTARLGEWTLVESTFRLRQKRSETLRAALE